MIVDAPAPYFRAQTLDGTEVLHPGPRARSGWGGRGQLRGTVVSGVLARAAERAAAELDGAERFRPVRWTLDLFRPAALAPTTADATVVRRGRRLRLVDAVLRQDGDVVARASALLLATDAAPAAGTVWAGTMGGDGPPVPQVRPATGEPAVYYSDDEGWTGSPQAHHNAARKMVWHLPEQLVEGETPSPFQRVATVADSSNLVANWGDHGIEFINADVTLALTRLPSGDGGIGLAAEGRHESDGIAIARTTVADAHGPLGTVLLSSLANTAAAVDLRTIGG